MTCSAISRQWRQIDRWVITCRQPPRETVPLNGSREGVGRRHMGETVGPSEFLVAPGGSHRARGESRRSHASAGERQQLVARHRQSQTSSAAVTGVIVSPYVLSDVTCVVRLWKSRQLRCASAFEYRSMRECLRRCLSSWLSSVSQTEADFEEVISA